MHGGKGDDRMDGRMHDVRREDKCQDAGRKGRGQNLRREWSEPQAPNSRAPTFDARGCAPP